MDGVNTAMPSFAGPEKNTLLPLFSVSLSSISLALFVTRTAFSIAVAAGRVKGKTVSIYKYS
jgi:hypothetical protein